MAQTIYFNKEYKQLMKEQIIVILLLWCVAIAGIVLARFNHNHYALAFIIFCSSAVPLIELIMYRNAIFRIDINESTCTFISRIRSTTVPVTDIESLVTLPNNVLSLRLKNTAGFILINGYLLVDDANLNKEFYLRWNKIFLLKTSEKEKMIDPFIKYISERNKKFKLINGLDGEKK
ncbi:MAG: hypothetical protein WCO98_02930 [bacterium]